MIEWLKKFIRRRKYPYGTKDGIRFRIVGDGVIEVDTKTVVESDKFKKILKDVDEITFSD